MPWAGQEIEHPEIGERVRFIRTAAERFTIVSGRLRVRIEREQREYGPGESAVVPPGTAHRFENASSETTHFRGEVRPALRTEEFFERLAALAQQHGATSSRHLGLMTLTPLISEYRREVALPRVPGTVQRAAIGILAAIARKRGGGELSALADDPGGELDLRNRGLDFE